MTATALPLSLTEKHGSCELGQLFTSTFGEYVAAFLKPEQLLKKDQQRRTTRFTSTHRTVGANKPAHVFYDAQDSNTSFFAEADLPPHVPRRYRLRTKRGR